MPSRPGFTQGEFGSWSLKLGSKISSATLRSPLLHTSPQYFATVTSLSDAMVHLLRAGDARRGLRKGQLTAPAVEGVLLHGRAGSVTRLSRLRQSSLFGV